MVLQHGRNELFGFPDKLVGALNSHHSTGLSILRLALILSLGPDRLLYSIFFLPESPALPLKHGDRHRS